MDAAYNSGLGFWIGLSDIMVEGSFRWMESHETPSYTNWGGTEPNDMDGIEDCVVKGVGGWNDQPCEIQYYALCQK